MRTALSDEPASEQEDVEGWRYDVLVRAGYDPDAAEVLALSGYVNLHVAVDLIRGGCDQLTAIQILL